MNILSLNFFSIILYGLIFLNKHTKEKWKKVFFVLTTTQLTLINGLRHTRIGVDTYRYARHFYRIREINSLSELLDYDLELGFVLLNKFVGFFFNHQFAFLLCAFIIYSCLAFFINKYSKNILLSYYLFITIGFFEGSFNTMRQSVAISLTLIAFYFAMEKKPQLFFLMTLIAASFHISALLIIPIVFMTHYQLDTKKICLIAFAYLLLLTFRYQLGELFIKIYYGDQASAFLEMYDMSSGLGGTALILIAFFILFTCMHQPVKNKSSVLLNATYNINILAIFIQTLSSFSYLFTRLNQYYLIYLLVYVPLLFEKSDHSMFKDYSVILEVAKKVVFVSIVLYLGYFYLDAVNNNINELLPFRFGWD